jgi:signal transduction histidine kinase
VPDSKKGRRPTPVQGILDALPVPVFLIDTDGRITQHNRTFQELWGGMARAGRWLPEWGENPLVALAPPAPTEVHLETDSRERRTFLQYVHPLEDQRAGVTGAVVVHVDVTEQRRGEEAQRLLDEATRILASSFEYTDTLRAVAGAAVEAFADWCGVYLVGDDGIHPLGTASRNAELGGRAEPIERAYPPTPSRGVAEVCRTGRPLLVPRVTEDFLRAEAVDDRHLELLRALGLRSFLIVPLLAHGLTLGAITFVVAESSRPYDADDLHIGERLADRVAIALENARNYHDAKLRVLQEEALRRAAAAVSAASTIPDVISEVADRALEAIDADGSFVERIDLSADEVELVAASGAWRPETGLRLPYVGSLAQTVIERAEPIRLLPGDHHDSVLLKQMTDACGPCAILVVPLRDGGEPIGCLILIRAAKKKPFEPDEVERAQAYGELASLAFRKIHLLEEAERRRVDLERVTESRNRLIRGFSHDLKNPLNAADGYLALLMEEFSEGLDERQLAFMSRVRGLMRAAIGLIEDLGELHRAEAGHIPVRPVPVEMLDLVREITEAYRPQAERKGLSLVLELPSEVPVIESDSSRVRQILGNLLSNAVKYTKAGEVRVTLSVRDLTSDDGSSRWILVQVADTGPGIPPDKRDAVFHEFTRVIPDASRGAGLGLAISQGIAEALLGRITVESEVGKGSTFTLWLPCVRRLEVPHAESPVLVDSWPPGSGSPG